MLHKIAASTFIIEQKQRSIQTNHVNCCKSQPQITHIDHFKPTTHILCSITLHKISKYCRNYTCCTDLSQTLNFAFYCTLHILYLERLVKHKVMIMDLFMCWKCETELYIGIIWLYLCMSVSSQLSPALRNRFTEIWCPQTNNRSDLVKIIQHNLRSGLSLDGNPFTVHRV